MKLPGLEAAAALLALAGGPGHVVRLAALSLPAEGDDGDGDANGDDRGTTGQGIPLELFPLPSENRDRRDLITVSRLSPRKRLDLLIRAFASLAGKPEFERSRLLIVGDTVGRDDVACKRSLQLLVTELGLTDRVVFLGHVPLQNMVSVYSTVAVHVNVSETGSMDKTVRLWDLSSSEPPPVAVGHTSAVFGTALSPDGKLVAESCFHRRPYSSIVGIVV